MTTLIATIGHSIVRRADGSWIPSPIYQEVGWPEGKSGRPVRTHIQKFVHPDSEYAYLGGGQIVVNALYRLWVQTPRADISIIGGRPPSMDRFGESVAGVSEASVMAEFLAEFFEAPCVPISVVGGTRNTDDDTRELIRLAQHHDRVIVVAMQFRLFRCRLLLEDFVRRNPSFKSVAMRIEYRDAEQFVPELTEQFVAMNQSKAYATTMEQELHGIRKLLKSSS